MKSAVFASALIGAAFAAPQGVTDKIAPSGGIPSGCSATYDGNFEITVAQVSYQKRDLVQKRAECGANGVLVLSLKDESVYDAQDRTGYIASNFQFQFDGPPQAGAIYTSGFSVCDDNLLALGSNKTFYRCLSGDFYNLYNENWAPQCEAVSIIAIPCGSSSSGASQAGDGQVIGTTVVQTTIVTALPDGQPQVITTSVPVPVTSYYPTSAPVSQISDGQIQVPPPQTATSVATASVSTYAPTTAVPTETGSASLPTAPASGSSSAAVSSPSVTKSASVTSAVSSSAAASSSAASTSAPAAGASSQTTASSLFAVVMALVALF